MANQQSTYKTSNSDDNVTIRSISGPLIINGDGGRDIVHVSSDEQKLDRINAFLAFDGGQDDDVDELVLDNSADEDADDVLNVTRHIVQVESMELNEVNTTEDADKNPILPRNSYVITLRNATGGSFNLSLEDYSTESTDLLEVFIPYPASAADIESAIDSMLIPNSKSCGQQETSVCSPSARVWQLGSSQTYAIFFMGERLNANISLDLNTDELESFYGEKFRNETNDILGMNSDVVYTHVDVLRIEMGHQEIVSNIRGTTAIKTYITTQEGDDKFFVASDANENTTTARTVEVSFGTLDYFEGDLHLEGQSGRHRLFISDRNSTTPKGIGADGPAVLSSSALEHLADNLGNIYYDANGGNWFDDLTLWLGEGGDEINITSLPTVGVPSRTTTSLHTGWGNDLVYVNLDASDNDGALFVANGQVSIAVLI